MRWARTPRLLAVYALALGSFACGGKAHTPSDTRSEGGASGGAMGSGGATSNSGGAAGGFSTGGAVECGGVPGVSETVKREDAVAGASTQGCGECTGRTLGELVALLQDDYPELAEISRFYDPSAPGGDGSSIYAFRSEAGFRLVFSKGSGDCEAGCIDHEYWYVETASFCYPYAAGRYSRTFDSARNCFAIEGEPLWGFPPAQSSGACDRVDVPEDVSGAHSVTARGSRAACSMDGLSAVPVVLSLVLRVERAADDPKHVTVRVEGSGNEYLEGASFEGDVARGALDISATQETSDGECLDNLVLQLHYDFGLQTGTLYLEEVHTLDCAAKPDEYCKGALQLDLGP